jgi:hypothetical protein
MASPLEILDEYLQGRVQAIRQLRAGFGPQNERLGELVARIQALAEGAPAEQPVELNDPDPQPSTEPPAKTRVPAWLAAAPLMSWGQIPNTMLTNVLEKDPEGIKLSNILAECGIALKQDGVELWFSNGGHADGSNNAVYSCRLGVDAPEGWVKRRSGTPSEFIYDWGNTPGQSHYLDGRPAARHTYWDAQFDEQRNKMLFVGAAAVLGNGNGSFPSFDAFDVARGDYDPAGTFPDLPGKGIVGVGRPCCMDDKGNVYRMDLHSNLYRWNGAQGEYGTWESLGAAAKGAIGIETALCFDPMRNRLVRFSQGPLVIDIKDDGSVRSEFVKKTGPHADVVKRVSSGFYSHTLDKYIFVPSYGDWDASTPQLFTIDPETWYVDVLPVAAPPDTTPGYVGRGCLYNRIMQPRDLDAIILFGRAHQDVFFIRLA